MDPITHGIAGALIGKAFFAGRKSPSHANSPKNNQTSLTQAAPPASVFSSTARVTIFAAVLGAVFPDIDVFADAFSHDPLAIARYHRGFTHSFVGLPIFAAALAWLTVKFFRWYAARPGHESWPPPSFSFLFFVYAAGIGSHILLDGLTDFGTRMWNPFSKDRVAWDFLFIIDFTFTALLLVPQLAAWVHGRRERARLRGTTMWVLLTAGAVAVWSAARAASFSFSFAAVVIASAIFAAIFFLPFRHRSGAPISRAGWSRIGFIFACAYIAAAGIAHRAAFNRVREFATRNHIVAEKIGAMPLPVSLMSWNGLIETSAGVYQSDFSLDTSAAPHFRFFADSPQNNYTREAAQLEPVRTYLWFARFPVMRFTSRNGINSVEYTDLRFFEGALRRPLPFTFYVSFDSNGHMLKNGWVRERPFSAQRPNR